MKGIRPYIGLMLTVWLMAAEPFTICAPAEKQGSWKVFEGCTYVPNESANDGDSFWVQCKRKKLKIRLYFVDTPETTDDEDWAVARLKDQAAYFKCDPKEALRVGLHAKKFTQRLLSKSDGFTVYTKMEEAMGRGKQRYYAMVEVNGRFLSEWLTENGFVRINKKTFIDGPLPNKMSVDKYEQHLRHLEQQARRGGLGGWAAHADNRPGIAARLRQQATESGSAEAVPSTVSESRIVVLKRSLPVYSLLTPGRLVRLLPPGVQVKVMEPAQDPGMSVIRFNAEEGMIYEAQCQTRDL